MEIQKSRIEPENVKVGDYIRVETIDKEGPSAIEDVVTTINRINERVSSVFGKRKGCIWVLSVADSREIFLLSRPKSETSVGTAGTVTTFGGRGGEITCRAIRYANGFILISSNGDWFSRQNSEIMRFTPDKILTDERVEQIRAEERERMQRALIDKLRPARDRAFERGDHGGGFELNFALAEINDYVDGAK